MDLQQADYFVDVAIRQPYRRDTLDLILKAYDHPNPQHVIEKLLTTSEGFLEFLDTLDDFTAGCLFPHLASAEQPDLAPVYRRFSHHLKDRGGLVAWLGKSPAEKEDVVALMNKTS